MRFTIIFILLSFTFCYGQPSDKYLFQISENDKYGFIDQTGRVIIKPIFRSLGTFSEGLAAARINGTYGYIDTTGNYIIKPQFDYATAFSNGLALVYKDGKHFFINKKGEIPFQLKFPFVESYKHGMALVQTKDKKCGFINTKGAIVIDTRFRKINPFIEGMAVVWGLKADVGVIDTLGRFIIPYGKYRTIDNFESGFFKVEISDDSQSDGFVDRFGNLVLAVPSKNHCSVDGNFHCGLAKMNLYKYWIPENKGESYTSEKKYEGFINLKGEIVINDTTYDAVEDFFYNRAFVRDNNWRHFLIDTHGKRVSENIFQRLYRKGFVNGLACVEKDGKCGLIDTNASFVCPPKFDGIDITGIEDGYFFFYNYSDDTTGEVEEEKLYGIARTDGSILLEPLLQDFSRNGFEHGLLICTINGKLSYINKEGRIVWQESQDKKSGLSNVNIDYMNIAHFYAHSKSSSDDIGGYGDSHNAAQMINDSNHFPFNSLSLQVVSKQKKDSVSQKYNTVSVFVANTLPNSIRFNAQDSRLYMKVQALNTKGEWKDIEYLPSSWCGNSYHTLSLETNHFWRFESPVYEGDFKTKFRIALIYMNPVASCRVKKRKSAKVIYSNEYDGSVNPGQFWRLEGHSPSSIMDSYFW